MVLKVIKAIITSITTPVLKPEECLVEKMAPEQAEEYVLTVFEELGIKSEWNDWQSTHWSKFISAFQQGDELWRYNTPDECWKDFSGREGFILYRNIDGVKTKVGELGIRQS